MQHDTSVSTGFLGLAVVAERRHALAALVAQAEAHFGSQRWSIHDVRVEPLGPASFAVSGRFRPRRPQP